MGSPLTRVPFVDPASTSRTESPTRCSSACRRLTPGSSRRTSALALRPTTVTGLDSATLASAPPTAALGGSALPPSVMTMRCRGRGTNAIADGVDGGAAGEGVTGLLRVGLQHFAEGLPQRLCVRRQPFVVVIAQGDDKAVRGNDPTWADHYPAIIDLPLQCASDVRGHRLALEDATKGTFNQTFEASLEAVEDTHRTRSFLTGHDRSRATSASRSPPVSYTHLTL